jgi:hypothetical protein
MPQGQTSAQHCFAGLHVDREVAVVALDDDAPCDVEAQAGALSYVFGGVKGFERSGLLS